MALAKSAFKTAPEYDPENDSVGRHHLGSGTPQGVSPKYLSAWMMLPSTGPRLESTDESAKAYAVCMGEANKDLVHYATRTDRTVASFFGLKDADENRIIYHVRAAHPFLSNKDYSVSFTNWGHVGFFFKPHEAGSKKLHVQVKIQDDYWRYKNGIVRTGAATMCPYQSSEYKNRMTVVPFACERNWTQLNSSYCVREIVSGGAYDYEFIINFASTEWMYIDIGFFNYFYICGVTDDAYAYLDSLEADFWLEEA